MNNFNGFISLPINVSLIIKSIIVNITIDVRYITSSATFLQIRLIKMALKIFRKDNDNVKAVSVGTPLTLCWFITYRINKLFKAPDRYMIIIPISQATCTPRIEHTIFDTLHNSRCTCLKNKIKDNQKYYYLKNKLSFLKKLLKKSNLNILSFEENYEL